MPEILPRIGALITIFLGFIGLIAPTKIAQLVSIKPDGLRGISEIRATYGGFFFGLGSCSLYFNNHVLFVSLGIAWLSAGFGRSISVICDRSNSAKNIAGILFESAIGLLFIISI